MAEDNRPQQDEAPESGLPEFLAIDNEEEWSAYHADVPEDDTASSDATASADEVETEEQVQEASAEEASTEDEPGDEVEPDEPALPGWFAKYEEKRQSETDAMLSALTDKFTGALERLVPQSPVPEAEPEKPLTVQDVLVRGLSAYDIDPSDPEAKKILRAAALSEISDLWDEDDPNRAKATQLASEATRVLRSRKANSSLRDEIAELKSWKAKSEASLGRKKTLDRVFRELPGNEQAAELFPYLAKLFTEPRVIREWLDEQWAKGDYDDASKAIAENFHQLEEKLSNLDITDAKEARMMAKFARIKDDPIADIFDAMAVQLDKSGDSESDEIRLPSITGKKKPKTPRSANATTVETRPSGNRAFLDISGPDDWHSYLETPVSRKKKPRPN